MLKHIIISTVIFIIGCGILWYFGTHGSNKPNTYDYIGGSICLLGISYTTLVSIIIKLIEKW